jgi:hypothetical protein
MWEVRNPQVLRLSTERPIGRDLSARHARSARTSPQRRRALRDEAVLAPACNAGRLGVAARRRQNRRCRALGRSCAPPCPPFLCG